MQNMAAQHVLRLPRRSSRNEMFTSLGWLTVNQLVYFHTVMAVFKIRHTEEPEYLAGKMKYDNFRGGLVVPATKLSLAKNSFCFRGADCWISLPLAIRNLKKIGEFKKALKIHTMTKIPKFLD